ncbi:hypothetical protein BDF20DRAFT_904176 [Mycotypha africana]|uniref:uncharacterized protein n=1 Tax=Mycotypha africana TaxID=64632 RepID=UPI0023009690|nr:uncharacterized protein BDF20DRAFT_904176 [Mycotypha africana]KAI8991616.1 hypothetical protein BDF20DRAFT_904176 [Mycotypha africana]
MTTSVFSSADYDEDPWGSASMNGTSSAYTIPQSYPTHLNNAAQANGSQLNSATIMQIVVPNGASYVTQSEFNTAIALVGCAQNKIGGYPQIKMITITSHHHQLPQQQLLAIIKSMSSITSIYEDSTTAAATPRQKLSLNNNPAFINTQQWFQNLEEVAVTVAPEREGFIFKHVNYIVTNEKRSSIVLRRYSDFWWLLEVLLKRYPFRAIPNLPPKKLGGRDDAFLEKRRKGLSRFINAIIRHPVLKQDDVVAKFLTEPSELAAWRKQNPPSLDEEFKRNTQPIRELDDMTPLNVEEQLQQAKKRISAGIKHYVNLCNIMERMIRRMHGQASDFSRFSIALNSLAEAELRYHAGECRNCQRVVRGYETVAKHMQVESNILEENDLDERRTRLSVNQSDTISKRVSANRAKVNQNKGVPGMEAEVEKLEEAIRADELEISLQQDHETFTKFCMWSELIYVHKQQAFVSSLYQSFVKETIRFSNLRAGNWQSLEEPAFEMPTDVDLFE